MIISETELFKGINFKDMQEIARICCEESYAKNTIIFRQNELAKCLYILEEGSVDLIVQNGGTLTYKLTEEGEIFGWSSMVENGRYTASVVCATDLKVIKIEREKLDQIFRLYPEVGLKLIGRMAAVFSKRLSKAYQNLLMVSKPDSIAAYG
jgi:CRP-like cAMP-binding protein